MQISMELWHGTPEVKYLGPLYHVNKAVAIGNKKCTLQIGHGNTVSKAAAVYNTSLLATHRRHIKQLALIQRHKEMRRQDMHQTEHIEYRLSRCTQLSHVHKKRRCNNRHTKHLKWMHYHRKKWQESMKQFPASIMCLGEADYHMRKRKGAVRGRHKSLP